MQLIDRLRAMQTAELDALSRPPALFGGMMPTGSLPPGLVGGLLVEQEIVALLHGATDADLRAAVNAATGADDGWTANHLAAEIERRQTIA